MYLYLQPFGEIDKRILEELALALKKYFNLPCKIQEEMELPFNAYFRRRRQWHSTTILELSLNKNIPEDATRVLGVTKVDLFVENLNFVFGEADAYHGTALISIFRLNPEYYFALPDEKLFHERVIKEAIHELGHTYHLVHCSNSKCIMHFSNTLADTDQKGPGFCEECRDKLEFMLK